MAAEFAKEKFALLGVTQFYDHGFLPAGPEELGKNFKKGEAVQKLDREGFLKHLQEFRARLKVSFPSLVAEKEDFRKYRVTGIPTLFVLTPEGKIAYIAVGGKKEAMLRIAIRRLLGAAPDPAEDQGKAEATRAMLKNVNTAIQMYELDFARYPEGGIKELMAALASKGPDALPYYDMGKNGKDGVLLDPWGRPFVYKGPKIAGGAYQIYSMGPNGVDDNGGGDDVKP